MEIFYIHVNFFARLDIGDRLREDVRPFLGEQRSHITLALRVLINLLRLFALANNAANPPLTDGHNEFIDGSVVRQREDIDRLDFARIRIVKLLGDLDRANVTADRGAHAGVLERHRNFFLV